MPNYEFRRVEGLMFRADKPQPAGTVPVYSWYSESRDDYFFTSHPTWRGSPDDTRSPDYRFIRHEGYIFDPDQPPPAGTIPLYAWYDPGRGDNHATSDRRWAGIRGIADKAPNYRYVRREGYVVPYQFGELAVPVNFLFEHDRTDPATGLPAYSSSLHPFETMREVDEALVQLHATLDQAKGLDSRRLRFVRAAVHYMPTPPDLSAQTTPFNLWWLGPDDNNLADNRSTTDPAWQPDGDRTVPDSLSYGHVRQFGLLFKPELPQPMGTVPLYGWYNPDKKDYLTSSHSDWAGRPGDERMGYRLERIEGYLYDPALDQPPNTFALHRWYSPSRSDHLSYVGLTWHGSPGEIRDPDYQYEQLEGYLPIPAGCEDLGRRLGEVRLEGTLSVLMVTQCPGVATSPWTARAYVGSLAHELGHLLGLYHFFEGNKQIETVEHLARHPDPSFADSCYKKGDRLCDTPPDYGFADAVGNENNQCDGRRGVPIPCQQRGPVCDLQEPIVDGRGVCRNVGTEGLRTYRPAALGLQLGTPNNIMAYHSQDVFTHEQFLSMFNYGSWRTGNADMVPDDERHVFDGFWGGPSTDVTWSMTPGRFHRLDLATVTSSPASFRRGRWTATIPRGAGERLFSFNVEVSFHAAPASVTELSVTKPDSMRLVAGADDLFLEDRVLILDEVYGGDQRHMRGGSPSGNWMIEIAGVANSNIQDIVLTVVSGQ